MPIKNIIAGQKVTKEKLQRAKELRREMTPAEKILWEELPPSGTFGGRINWESTFGGSRSFRDSSLIFTVTPSAFGTSPKFHELGIWGRQGGGQNDEVARNLSAVGA